MDEIFDTDIARNTAYDTLQYFLYRFYFPRGLNEPRILYPFSRYMVPVLQKIGIFLFYRIKNLIRTEIFLFYRKIGFKNLSSEKIFFLLNCTAVPSLRFAYP